MQGFDQLPKRLDPRTVLLDLVLHVGEFRADCRRRLRLRDRLGEFAALCQVPRCLQPPGDLLEPSQRFGRGLQLFERLQQGNGPRRVSLLETALGLAQRQRQDFLLGVQHGTRLARQRPRGTQILPPRDQVTLDGAPLTAVSHCRGHARAEPPTWQILAQVAVQEQPASLVQLTLVCRLLHLA